MTPNLCIYHGNCADGFTSAWVVRKALEHCEFHSAMYQTPPPDVEGRHVYIVDFSYKRPVLEEMARKARSITILDHHKTAAEDLAPFTHEKAFYGHDKWSLLRMTPFEFEAYCGMVGCLPIRALFDMKRSGAGITWDYFFGENTRPELLNHIEDRDLWKFSLRGTREIQANVFSYPYDFKVWDWLFEQPVDKLQEDGAAIERKHFKDIRELIKVVKRDMAIGGFVVPMANLPYTLTSDAGHIMSKGEGSDADPEHPFAGCYWDTPEGRVFSLRSAEGGMDVGDIAKQYGGGGHKHASGFMIPWTKRSLIQAIEDCE